MRIRPDFEQVVVTCSISLFNAIPDGKPYTFPGLALIAAGCVDPAVMIPVLAITILQTAYEQAANRASAGTDQGTLAATNRTTDERAAHSAHTHVLLRGGTTTDSDHGNHGNNHLPHRVTPHFVSSLQQAPAAI